MKKLICVILCMAVGFSVLCTSYTASAEADFSKSPNDFVSDIKVGWNLGNTFENSSSSWAQGSISVTQQETSKSNPVTTQAMIDLVADSGFNAVRIPFTWYYAMSYNESTGICSVKQSFIDRAKQVIDYCFKRGLYVILDTHHDDKIWINIAKQGAEFEKIKKMFGALWKTLGTAFKDYDQKLILEGVNEAVPIASDGSQDWWGKQEYYFDNLNALHKIFVDTVRSTGGNNDKRYLMLSTLGAQWYKQQVSRIVPPNNDPHLILDVHWYTATTDFSVLTQYFLYMYEFSQSNKMGCVLGECGITTSTREDQEIINWANAYISTAKSYNFPCFLWDDGGNYQIMKRKNDPPYWVNYTYVNSVVKASGLVQGICGTNVKWIYNSGTGALEISGTGAMNSYKKGELPWNSVIDKIFTVSVKPGVTSISANAFYDCKKLESVSIADSVTSIGISAFKNCFSIKSIKLPQKVTSINDGMFANCYALNTVELSDNLKYIGSNAFYSCFGLAQINFPTTLSAIGDSAFYECLELSEMSFYKALSYIGDFAFGYCENIEKITFYGSSTKAYNYTFYGCKKLVLKCYRNSEIYKLAQKYNYQTELFTTSAKAISIENPLNFVRGETVKLNVSLTPDYSSDEVTYQSSDESVVTVDINGNLYGVSKGNCIVTATAQSGVSTTCDVRVVVNTKSIKLNKNSLVLHKNKSFRLKYTATPVDNEDKFTFYSSNKKVATVDNNGKVVALSNGKAIITVIASSGAKSSCNVTVYTLKASVNKKTIKKGKSFKLKVTGAKIKKFKSSKPSVAKTTQKGKITARKKGTCYITATDIYGVSVRCKISVK